MRKILILACIVSVSAAAQTITDTLTFMHYNVLNYRNITSFCTVDNNNPTEKETHMRTIVSYVLPDIITCNEMAGDGGTAARRMLDNALNQQGRAYYKQATYSANSNLSNMLYYNRNKLALHKQDKIDRGEGNTQLVRQIDAYTLYYLDQSELDQGDTTFLTVYVAHLKASTGSVNVAERAVMTAAVMEYHEANYDDAHSYIISGDFNTYTSSEEGYQNLVNGSTTAINFYDPIDKSGSWNNSGTYASVHTQSTRVSDGCHSGGGLDDRFDFVLCGKELLDNTRGLGYVAGSYTAVGNDGNHFNSDINSGTNNSAPKDVLDALYGMSDHLPITIKMTIDRTVASVTDKLANNYLLMSNPIDNQLQWKMQLPVSGTLRVTDATGKEVHTQHIVPSSEWYTSDVSGWAKGAYYASFTAADGQVIRKKLIKM